MALEIGRAVLIAQRTASAIILSAQEKAATIVAEAERSEVPVSSLTLSDAEVASLLGQVADIESSLRRNQNRLVDLLDEYEQTAAFDFGSADMVEPEIPAATGALEGSFAVARAEREDQQAERTGAAHGSGRVEDVTALATDPAVAQADHLAEAESVLAEEGRWALFQPSAEPADLVGQPAPGGHEDPVAFGGEPEFGPVSQSEPDAPGSAVEVPTAEGGGATLDEAELQGGRPEAAGSRAGSPFVLDLVDHSHAEDEPVLSGGVAEDEPVLSGGLAEDEPDRAPGEAPSWRRKWNSPWIANILAAGIAIAVLVVALLLVDSI